MSAAEPFIPPVPASVERNGVLLPLELIESVDRIREVTEAGAAMMAGSLAAKGLISPIMVRPATDGRYRLVLGGHRFAGASLLGWHEIVCDVREMDDDEAEDLELRENLDRTDLTKLDQMIFMARRKALDDRAAARPKAGGDRQSEAGKHSANVGGMVPRLTQELAVQINRSERTVQRAIQIVESLDPEVIRLIRSTKHADNEQTLLKLSRETPAKQRTLAAQLSSGVVKTIAQATVAAGFEEPLTEDPQKRILGQLEKAWTDANMVTRLAFLDLIDAAFLGANAKHNSAATQVPYKATPAREFVPETEIARVEASSKPSRGGRKPAKSAR